MVRLALLLFCCLPVCAQSYLGTGLPVCYINTEDSLPIASKQNYVNAKITITLNGDTLLRETDVSVRGRGNATWAAYPKKPYKLKFDKKTNILSCKGKHFVLLANYCDKSLMRVGIGFQASRLIGMEWTPADDFFELVLNGEYLGNYQLAETVRQAKDRLNIMDSGFLLQYDKYWYKNEPVYFFSDIYRYPMIVKFPDEEDLTKAHYDYIKTEINGAERCISTNVSGIWDKFDLDSFAKWYYVSNVLMLYDANYYFLKYDNKSGSKIHIGPLWDFEWCLGIGWYEGEERPNPNHELVNDCYFEQLSTDNAFMHRVLELHKEYGQLMKEGILDYYDLLEEKLALSQMENFKKWDILGETVSVGAYPLGSWEAEVACDKEFFVRHFDFLDAFFKDYEEYEVSVNGLPATNKKGSIYTIDGRLVPDGEMLRRGFYVKNGKKWFRP